MLSWCKNVLALSVLMSEYVSTALLHGWHGIKLEIPEAYLCRPDMSLQLAVLRSGGNSLKGRPQAMALDEGIQHGLWGHGALLKGGLPEGVLAHGLPGQPGGWILVQQLSNQVLEVKGSICIAKLHWQS